MRRLDILMSRKMLKAIMSPHLSPAATTLNNLLHPPRTALITVTATIRRERKPGNTPLNLSLTPLEFTKQPLSSTLFAPKQIRGTLKRTAITLERIRALMIPTESRRRKHGPAQIVRPIEDRVGRGRLGNFGGRVLHVHDQLLHRFEGRRVEGLGGLGLGPESG
ncbi:hypothetical protein CASFOL_033670 [Castilleja foliolosa]|uniref:Uncharacterized protein n=1 Tax=Castilleja foliolosa TaxID=1961234 RepID=A0ABD3BY81_9LAMI